METAGGGGRPWPGYLLWAKPGLGLELGWGLGGGPGLASRDPCCWGSASLCWPALVLPPLQVCPTWPCPKHPGPHLYANHPWGPQLPAGRGGRRNLHFLAPELAQPPSGGRTRSPLQSHLTHQAAETRGRKGPGHRAGSRGAGVQPQPVWPPVQTVSWAGSANLPLNQWAPWEAAQPPVASGTTAGWRVTHGWPERSPTPCNSVPDLWACVSGPRAGCSGGSQHLGAPRVTHPVRPLPAG